MDKQVFMKAESEEKEAPVPSAPAPKKLTLRVKTVARRKYRCGFYFYRNFLIFLNVLYLVTNK